MNQSPNQRRERERQVRAEHVEAAVREVDDAHDPEDQRQAAGDQEQQQAVLDGVQALDEEGGEVHAASASEACRQPRTGGGRGVRPAVRGTSQPPARSELAAARRVGERLDRDADELVLVALDLAQVDVLHRVVRLAEA